eukprot:3045471-Rhodomonas_salina.1
MLCADKGISFWHRLRHQRQLTPTYVKFLSGDGMSRSVWNPSNCVVRSKGSALLYSGRGIDTAVCCPGPVDVRRPGRPGESENDLRPALQAQRQHLPPRLNAARRSVCPAVASQMSCAMSGADRAVRSRQGLGLDAAGRRVRVAQRVGRPCRSGGGTPILKRKPGAKLCGD